MHPAGAYRVDRICCEQTSSTTYLYLAVANSTCIMNSTAEHGKTQPQRDACIRRNHFVVDKPVCSLQNSGQKRLSGIPMSDLITSAKVSGPSDCFAPDELRMWDVCAGSPNPWVPAGKNSPWVPAAKNPWVPAIIDLTCPT